MVSLQNSVVNFIIQMNINVQFEKKWYFVTVICENCLKI